jgi:LysM repeat protein
MRFQRQAIKSASALLIASFLVPASALAQDSGNSGNGGVSTQPTYTAQAGDTIDSVAAAAHVSIDALMAANPQLVTDQIPEGTVMNLPAGADMSVHGSLRFDGAPTAVRNELQDEAKDAAANPTARPGILRTAAGMTFDPVFIGAIAIKELADAGVSRDPDKLKDLGHQLESPDFYAGVGIFNATYRGANAAADAASGALAKTRLGVAVADAEIPFLGAGGKLLRDNVVLAAALTLPRLVQFDFGGFTVNDAVHGDFRKLKDAKVGLGHVDAEDTAITLGSFMVAQPIWSGIKSAFRIAAEKFLVREAVAAPVEAGALAVPVGGEVFDAAVTVGNVVWAAADLAGLLYTASKIEKPVQEWNDKRRFENAADDAIKNLMQVAAQNGGNPKPDDFEKALANCMSSFRNLRDLHYLPAAYDDATFVLRAERAGDGDRQLATKAKLTQLSQQVTQDYGVDLAALAQTVVLKRSYDASTASGAPDQDLSDTYGRYRNDVKDEIRSVYAESTLPEERLDPSASDFALSDNRAQLYSQEAVVYARVRSILKDDHLRSRMADEITVVGALKNVDARLVQEALGETPSPTTTAAATPATAPTSTPAPATAPTATPPAATGPGGPAVGNRQGMTDALDKGMTPH